jgi:hypothetical protein
MDCLRCGRDLLIPEVQVNDAITREAKRAVGKHDLTVQSAELSPENAVRLLGVLENALPLLQPPIKAENELCPKWPPVANGTFAPFIHERELN